MIRRLSSALMLVVLSVPGVVGAQSADPGNLPAIDPGKTVRARLTTEATITGRFMTAGSGRLGIETESGRTESVPIEQIRELAVQGRHTKTGAIVGGIVGVAFGTFVAYVAHGLCETDSCDGIEPYAIAIPVLGASGALVGAAIGTAFPKWKRVYP